MKTKLSSIFTTAIVSGLLSASAMAAETPAPAAPPADATATEKDSCCKEGKDSKTCKAKKHHKKGEKATCAKDSCGKKEKDSCGKDSCAKEGEAKK